MTFELEGFVKKLCSPITLIENETVKHFNSGKELAEYEFPKRYKISTVYAKDNSIVIEVEEEIINAPNNFIGEEPINYK
ncbi:MAG: hypothetical protein IKI68_00635 [Clostridia bacterium]|nr:hypothetical protein [Clostridia bacterium]